ncbi:RIP homotypic interaction motif-containing protein [Nocardia abscessus]|uniref:RIP homotypic interaction motif-containing protein n=1 Tax=Nocardia abscessus TaxID=120957 RepID=UPI002456D1F7|nr:RIP homotypic interaction motif-containing protein [Nocardia abscessus]
MDPLTIIVSALIAGAAAGGKDAASAAVRDAYTALRDRLTGGDADSGTITVIEANEAVPGGNIGELEARLGERAIGDRELQAAAEALLLRLPSDRVDHARSRIDLSHAQGVQIGDHNTQHNAYGGDRGPP